MRYKFILSLSIVLLAANSIKAQSIGELLDKRAATTSVEDEKTKQQWRKLLAAFAGNEEATGRKLAQDFLGMKTLLTPQQIQATQLLLRISPPSGREESPVNAQIRIEATKVAADLAAAQAQLNRVEALAAQLPKTFTQGGQTHVRWVQLSKEKAFWTAEKEKLTTRQEELKANYGKLQSSERDAVETELLGVSSRLAEQNDIEGALALCNTYLRKNPAAKTVAAKGQELVELRNIYVRAQELAVSVERDAKKLLANGELWAAKTEFEKSQSLVESRITDAAEKKAFSNLLRPLADEITRRIDDAGRKMGDLELLATNDPEEAAKQLEALKANVRDHPQIQSLQTKIKQANDSRAMASYQTKLDAVRKLSQSDPSAAKSLLDEFQKTISKDDASIIRAELHSIRSGILKGEIDLIRGDMDEAHSFLTKVSANFAIQITKRDRDAVRATLTHSQAIENLTRARGLLESAAKRIEALPVTEMDTVLRSRSDGLKAGIARSMADIEFAEETGKSTSAVAVQANHPSDFSSGGIKKIALYGGIAIAAVVSLVVGIYFRSQRRGKVDRVAD